MTIARREVVSEGEISIFHCISRCVRRAFLCGEDTYSGRNYEHRKEWIKSRIRELAAGYAMEISAYAIMSNHLHIVLRTRPDWVETWSDREVAERWLKLFPKFRRVEDGIYNPNDSEINILSSDLKRMAEIRLRLSSVSWFMRSLNEYVARTANREDGGKGRFWDGRFRCQALLDESAVLTCMAYVDLNPIRAGLTDRPEYSDFTSVQERIREKEGGLSHTSWLAPFGEGGPEDSQGFLPMTSDEYLSLVDWTGRQVRQDKPGAIPGHLSPLLERLQINRNRWVVTVHGYRGFFHRVAGRGDSIINAARRLGNCWLAGLSAGRQAFSSDKIPDGCLFLP